MEITDKTNLKSVKSQKSNLGFICNIKAEEIAKDVRSLCSRLLQNPDKQHKGF